MQRSAYYGGQVWLVSIEHGSVDSCIYGVNGFQLECILSGYAVPFIKVSHIFENADICQC